MYLSDLNKEQRQQFIKLANYLSRIDEDLSLSEVNLINLYKKKMDFEDDIDYMEINTLDLDMLNIFFDTEFSKRFLVFELLGLALIDGRYDSLENDLIEKLFLSISFKDRMISLISNYLTIQSKINSLMLGERNG